MATQYPTQLLVIDTVPVVIEIELEDQAAVVKVTDPEGNVGTGRAAPAHDDHYVPAIGVGIAVGRALQSLGEAIESTWAKRVVSKAEVARRRGQKATRRQTITVETTETTQVHTFTEITTNDADHPTLEEYLRDLGGEG